MSENIVIVGPGRLGLALGAALDEAGAVERLTFFGRDLDPPPHPLFDVADGRVQYALGPRALPEERGCHPGRARRPSFRGRAPPRRDGPGAGRVRRAAPGRRDLDRRPLAAAPAGYAVGSMHPLQTVADPWSGGDRLRGVAFALAGEPEALAVARRLVRALDGQPLVIPPKLRPLYHAAAVFASNYLVALVSAAVRLLGQTGVDEEDAVAAVLPLIRGTLNNLGNLGVGAALTGPIARGDVDTVRLHLARLSPEDRALYCALGARRRSAWLPRRGWTKPAPRSCMHSSPIAEDASPYQRRSCRDRA